jgi:hypothetical protein
MPCACQLPPEIYPDASEWGPILWSILHGIAERVGSTAFAQYQADERRALIRVMKSLVKVIPCPSCKEHYDVYLKENPVDKTIMDTPYRELTTSLSRPLFPYDDLTPTYKSVPLRQRMKDLDVPMKKAIRLRSGQLMGYTEFNNQCMILFSIFGI